MKHASHEEEVSGRAIVLMETIDIPSSGKLQDTAKYYTHHDSPGISRGIYLPYIYNSIIYFNIFVVLRQNL
jgi:hypothetical protein